MFDITQPLLGGTGSPLIVRQGPQGPVHLAIPLKEDSKMGAGFCARKSFLAYLLRAPLFSVGTMSWRMKRARSRMS